MLRRILLSMMIALLGFACMAQSAPVSVGPLAPPPRVPSFMLLVNGAVYTKLDLTALWMGVMDANISNDGKTGTISWGNKQTLTLSVDYPPMRNAAKTALDVRAVYQDRILYAPLKYLAGQLGVTYQEDLVTKEVSVTRDTGVKLLFSTLPNQPMHEITPLHDAAARSDVVAISTLLQANPIAIDARMLSGATPLHMAAFEGREDAIILLAASKARMNLHDRNGFTPLAAASFQNKPLAVKALLDNGADINAVDSYGQTALFMSVLNKKPDIFNLLMEKKADFKIVETATGFTPLHIAVQNGSLNFVQQLIDAGANVNAQDIMGITPLDQAAEGDNAGLVEYLLAKGADVKLKTKNGMTALHGATRGGNQNILLVLLKAPGIDIDANAPNVGTALHLAVIFGNLEQVQSLVAKGANINATGAGLMTPLHLAAATGNSSIATFLVNWGADVNKKAENGSTPLHTAVATGNTAIAEFLLGKNAAINVKNKDGKTPLAVANEALMNIDPAITPENKTNMEELKVNMTGLIKLLTERGATL